MRYNNTRATTCATMHREEKNGTTTATLNGTIETAAVKDEYITHPRPERTNYNQGGRLKFFKDGKFILELERAREGERVSWVSVPRKTFWPPQSTPTSTPTYRQESSTSLSVSDDNSSIQSSPWQRDHSWKQTTPQRNLSKPLCFYYRRPRRSRTPNSSSGSQSPVLNINSHHKCHYRRPYHDINVKLEKSDGNVNTVDNNTSSPLNVKAEKMAVADGKANVKSAETAAEKLRGKFRAMGLLAIVQSLVERIGVSASVSGSIANGISSLGAIRTPPRQDVIVSPRKRFLREMDRDNKVALEDNCQKRSRSKQSTTLTNNNTSITQQQSTSSNNNNNNAPSCSSTITTTTSVIPITVATQQSFSINGTTTSTTSPSPTATSVSLTSHTTVAPSTAITTTTSTSTTQRSSSSYSITSLLADDRPSSGSSGGGSNRGGRKTSPVNVASVITNTTPSHGYLGYGSAGSHVLAAGLSSVEERLYTENVDRLRSIELSHADKRAAAAATAALSYSSLHSTPPLPPPGPVVPPLPSPYAAYLPYHHHPALYHPHHYVPTATTPSPMYYAALYASQQQQQQQAAAAAAANSRTSPYAHHHLHHPPSYALPTLHPPPPTVTTSASRSHATVLTGLHHHHHHHSTSGSSVWSTPSPSGLAGLRQAAAALPNLAMTQPADLSRLQPPIHHHPANLTGSSGGAGVGGATIHNDAVSDMPLNLSKNAG